MTRLEHLLTILVEECGETGQRATKALRFGIKEVQKGQDLDNSQRLTYEFNDIVAMMEMLQEEGHLDVVIDREAIGKKKEKVEKYLLLSQEQGTLDNLAQFPLTPDECIKQ